MQSVLVRLFRLNHIGIYYSFLLLNLYRIWLSTSFSACLCV
jgi:hypothetical protein